MSGGEKTFVMVKPDGLQRGLVGKIMTRYAWHTYIAVSLQII